MQYHADHLNTLLQAILVILEKQKFCRALFLHVSAEYHGTSWPVADLMNRGKREGAGQNE
jgi:hypothetical protein